ncbi:MAG: hypothetical protein A3F43_04590 [Gammaproteobacteria bacterium RIFCSPHIGHO2_12_FULL_42_10]|nr:MAG: hypothetical protein A3F43_04590 [Gammaproteobacteria bacterium RIFCSPHIGHO2_12_FULL_42_10]
MTILHENGTITLISPIDETMITRFGQIYGKHLDWVQCEQFLRGKGSLVKEVALMLNDSYRADTEQRIALAMALWNAVSDMYKENFATMMTVVELEVKAESAFRGGSIAKDVTKELMKQKCSLSAVHIKADEEKITIALNEFVRAVGAKHNLTGITVYLLEKKDSLTNVFGLLCSVTMANNLAHIEKTLEGIVDEQPRRSFFSFFASQSKATKNYLARNYRSRNTEKQLQIGALKETITQLRAEAQTPDNWRERLASSISQLHHASCAAGSVELKKRLEMQLHHFIHCKITPTASL